MGSVTQLVAPALPDVSGYVEAVTADRVIGWAWGPRSPGRRAEVELRLGDTVVAQATADRPRPDLASSGIGDGNHAFEIGIPEAHRARAAEFVVFARVGDGVAAQIGAPPPAETAASQLGGLRQGLDALVGSQRHLHRMLQAALSRESQPSDSSAIANLTEKQAEMAEQVATLERFVVRLDEVLLSLAPQAAAGPAIPRAALCALAVAGLAFVVSVAGLVRSLGG